MNKHIRGNGRDIGKKGMNVDVKFSNNDEQASAFMDQAIRVLKKRMVEEGVIKDLRKKEFYESKGQARRRKKNEAIRRQIKKNSEQTEV